MHTKTILKKGTVVYLSEIGYYNYYYVNRDKPFTLDKDETVKILSNFRSGRPEEEGWNAYLMLPKSLEFFPNRPSNIVWIQGENNER